MSAITNFSINLEKIPADQKIKAKTGTWVNLTLFQNDEVRFGNNASCTIKQSKEQSDAGEKRIYLGNGQVTYVSDEGITKAPVQTKGEEAPASDEVVTDGLPF